MRTYKEQTALILEKVNQHNNARKKHMKIHKFFIIPASSVAAFFISFILLVNLSVTFAMACERIPFLRELAAAVSFSPSLSAAVENEYVQIIDIKQTENDINMKVEYVIVDQKQLNIFYTLQSTKYSDMDVTPVIRNSEGEMFGNFSIYTIPEKNGFHQIVVDFHDTDVPDSLILESRVHDIGNNAGNKLIATLFFTLDIDPEYTQKGETITLNQELFLDGQSLTLTTVEIYPTHIRVNFTDDENNTAWLTSLKFYFMDEKGRTFAPIANGITATGSVNSPFMASHRLESSFFSQSKSLTMFITESSWRDKDVERVKIDLVNSVSDNLPECMNLEKAVKNNNSWELTFSTVERVNKIQYMFYDRLFERNYYDEAGNEYEYDTWSAEYGYYDEVAGKFIETPSDVNIIKFTLKDYPYKTVYLLPIYHRMAKLETPIEVKVK